MALAELLPDVDVPRDIVVRGLTLDSRSVQSGDAFVAIAGFGAHGLNFAAQAKENGASAILFEAPVPDGLEAPREEWFIPGTEQSLFAIDSVAAGADPSSVTPQKHPVPTPTTTGVPPRRYSSANITPSHGPIQYAMISRNAS